MIRLVDIKATFHGHILTTVLENKREMFSIAFFSAIVNLMMLAPTLYMLQVFDRVLISRSYLTLYVLTFFVLFFYLVQSFADWTRSKLVIATGIHLESILGPRIFEVVFANQLDSARKNPLQPFSDLSLVRQWITSQAIFAFFDIPWSIIYLIVMFLLHPVLGILAIIFIIVLALFALWSGSATRASAEEALDEEREHNQFIYTKLRNAEVIEAHGMVQNLEHEWWKKQTAMLKKQAKSHELEERFIVSSKEIRVLMQSLALGVGALLALKGEISFGAMIAAALLVGRVTSPIDQIVSGWKGFALMRRALVRLEELLSVTKKHHGSNLSNFDRIEVIARNYCAYSNGKSIEILKGLNFSMYPGRIYAVVGHSGAGKSTLGRGIVGAWPVTNEALFINEIAVSTLVREEFGKRIGYLPQDIQLFSGSVAENIARMGKPDSQKVIVAAKLAGVHDLILRLPKGYDTQIGEAGAYLSGGQRQRVGLARALYGDPRLIVLDEPNANLDDQGQKALSSALLEMRLRGATIVLITHQHMLLSIVDDLVIIENGSIVLTGDRNYVQAEMRARKLVYSELTVNPAETSPTSKFQ